MLLVDQRHPSNEVHVARKAAADIGEETPVDLINDQQMPGQQPPHQIHGPGFQRLRQQRVVGIGEGPNGDIPGGVPVELMGVDENPHEFRNRDRGMRIVELDRDLVGQGGEVGVIRRKVRQDVLDRGRDEEILLPQPQLAAHLGRVIRVQDFRQVLGLGFLLHGPDVVALVEVAQVEIAGGLGRPQPQVVDGLAAKAGNRRVVGHGHHVLCVLPLVTRLVIVATDQNGCALELHPVDDVGAGKLPRVAEAQPVVGMLDLPALFDLLGEHAVFVANAVPEPGHVEGREGVEKTGGQPAQPAVAQTGFHLPLADFLQSEADIFQCAAKLVAALHVEHGVAQGAAHQEFHRQVVHPLGILQVVTAHGFHPLRGQQIANHMRQRLKPVALGGVQRVLAQQVQEPMHEGAFQIRRVGVRCGVVQGIPVDGHGVEQDRWLAWHPRHRRASLVAWED